MKKLGLVLSAFSAALFFMDAGAMDGERLSERDQALMKKFGFVPGASLSHKQKVEARTKRVQRPQRIQRGTEQRVAPLSVEQLRALGRSIMEKGAALLRDSQIPMGREGYLDEEAYAAKLKDVVKEITQQIASASGNSPEEKASVRIAMTDITAIDKLVFDAGFTLYNNFANDPDENKVVSSYALDEQDQPQIEYKD